MPITSATRWIIYKWASVSLLSRLCLASVYFLPYLCILLGLSNSLVTRCSLLFSSYHITSPDKLTWTNNNDKINCVLLKWRLIHRLCRKPVLVKSDFIKHNIFPLKFCLINEIEILTQSTGYSSDSLVGKINTQHLQWI